jgi:hypothetical protein
MKAQLLAPLALALSLLATPCAAQPLRPDATLLLARIKQRMAQNLARVPNYTCLETIERTQLGPPASDLKVEDTVRVEVALVSGRELFAWPGARKFEEKGLGALVRGGTVTTGDFTLYARTVFLSHFPTFTYAGEENTDGRPAVRYDYRVSPLVSGYKIEVGKQSGTVGFHGSFWADSETLELIRLDVEADQIPPDLSVSLASTSIRYAKTHVGASDFLLPQSVHFVLRHSEGEESRNLATFSRCHEYVGEAEISFDQPPEKPSSDAPPAGEQTVEIQVPLGLSFETRLKTPIDSKVSAVGDAITAVLSRPVQIEGAVRIPKGTLLHGRIRRLDLHITRSQYYVVGLEFSRLDFGGRPASLFAELEHAGPKPLESSGSAGLNSRRLPSVAATPPIEILRDFPEVGTFVIPGKRCRLPSGFRLVWKTAAPPKE